MLSCLLPSALWTVSSPRAGAAPGSHHALPGLAHTGTWLQLHTCLQVCKCVDSSHSRELGMNLSPSVLSSRLPWAASCVVAPGWAMSLQTGMGGLRRWEPALPERSSPEECGLWTCPGPVPGQDPCYPHSPRIVSTSHSSGTSPAQIQLPHPVTRLSLGRCSHLKTRALALNRRGPNTCERRTSASRAGRQLFSC